MQKRRSYDVVSYQAGERPNANKIIIYQPFWNADHKNQPGPHAVVAEWNPGAAAPNTNDNFIYQIRARMGEYDAVFDDTGVRLFSREHLFKERVRVTDLPILDQQLDNLGQRVWDFPRTQRQDHLFFIEQIGQRDSHWEQRDLLDYPAKPVIQLNTEQWQLKTQR